MFRCAQRRTFSADVGVLSGAGETWSTSRVQAKVSRDHAVTWSDAFPLVNDEGMMVCNRPILLHQGDYLLPLYFESGHDPEFTAADSSSLFLRYDAKSKTWNQTGRIRSATGNIQPAPVELAPDHQHRGGDRDDPELGGHLEEVDDARRREQAAAAGDDGEEDEDENRARHGAELRAGHEPFGERGLGDPFVDGGSGRCHARLLVPTGDPGARQTRAPMPALSGCPPRTA